MSIRNRIYDGLTYGDIRRLTRIQWPDLKWSKDGVAHVARYGNREYSIVRTDLGYRTIVSTPSQNSKVVGRPIRTLSDAKTRCEMHNALAIDKGGTTDDGPIALTPPEES
jgi:hypothetical protein